MAAGEDAGWGLDITLVLTRMGRRAKTCWDRAFLKHQASIVAARTGRPQWTLRLSTNPSILLCRSDDKNHSLNRCFFKALFLLHTHALKNETRAHWPLFRSGLKDWTPAPWTAATDKTRLNAEA
jgi:hypothetical protein